VGWEISDTLSIPKSSQIEPFTRRLQDRVRFPSFGDDAALEELWCGGQDGRRYASVINQSRYY